MTRQETDAAREAVADWWAWVRREHEKGTTVYVRTLVTTDADGQVSGVERSETRLGEQAKGE